MSLISTNIENEWAILVSGRRLFAWNYAQASVIKTCYELQLPASDISHKADLVCLIFPSEKNSIPAILAVSPEGHYSILKYLKKDFKLCFFNLQVPSDIGRKLQTATTVSNSLQPNFKDKNVIHSSI